MKNPLHSNPTKAPPMRLIALLTLLASSALAAPQVNNCNYGASGNIPQSSGYVTNILTPSASTVVGYPVPATANTVIAAGSGDFYMCENKNRCGTFPTSYVSGTGYLFNPNGRMLPLSGGTVSITAPVTGTFIQLEFCKQI